MNFLKEIFFSPYSLDKFPVLIFSIFTAIYLLFHPARSIQSITAAIYFLFSFLFHFGFFFAYSIDHPSGAFGYYLTALSPLGVAVLVQFAYYFPRDVFPLERRMIFYLMGILSVLSFFEYCFFAYRSGVGAFTAGYGSYYISKTVPILNLCFYSWAIFIFIRKTIYHSGRFHATPKNYISHLLSSGGKEALVCRNFAILNFLDLLNSIILTSGLLFRTFSYSHYSILMNINFFILNTMYIIFFIKYLIGSIPYTFKVLHFSFLSTLVLCTVAGKLQIQNSIESFESIRKAQIQKILPSLSAPDGVEFEEPIELILSLETDNSYNILYKKADLTLPPKLNLYKEVPGLLEYIDSPHYPDYSLLKKSVEREFYLRISNKNIQFYPILYKEKLYGIGYDFREYRHFLHSQVKTIFILYALLFIFSFVLLPFYLSYSNTLPKGEILTGLYLNNEFSLSRLDEKTEDEEVHVIQNFSSDAPDTTSSLVSSEIEGMDGQEDSVSGEQILKESTLRKIKKVEDYLKENYTCELSREGLASMVNLSPGRLGKYFKLSTGRKIGEYINHLRIERAKSLLLNTRKTVLEIAFEVGFESLRTFNRVFFSEMGVNPMQFRQKK